MRTCILLCFCLSVVFGAPAYRALGSFPLSEGAFASVAQFDPTNNASWTLLISSFTPDPLYDGYIYYVDDIGSQLNSFSNIQATLLSDSVVWPNEVLGLPLNTFGTPTVIASGGFLVPGFTTGSINLFKFSPPNVSGPFKISEDKSGYFFHRSIFKDLNGDGFLDVLTARATDPVIWGNAGGQLLWYENPGSNSDPFANEWKEHILLPGPDAPDVFFRLIDIDGDGQDELLAAQFFNPKLVIYWASNWNDSSSINSRIVDDSVGPCFDLQWVDLNGDGKKEILLTNNINVASQSAIFAYEIPKNWKTDSWTRHTLANGFVTRYSGKGHGAPGEAIATFPTTNGSGKPVILLSGDDASEAYLISPNSQDPTSWSYSLTTILSYNTTGGTVGSIAVGDVNGDGWNEFFIPTYSLGQVFGYTFAP